MLSFQIFIKCDMRRGQQRMRWLNGITDSLDMRLSKLREIVKDMEAWHSVLHGIAKNQKWLRDREMTNRQCILVDVLFSTQEVKIPIAMVKREGESLSLKAMTVFYCKRKMNNLHVNQVFHHHTSERNKDHTCQVTMYPVINGKKNLLQPKTTALYIFYFSKYLPHSHFIM